MLHLWRPLRNWSELQVPDLWVAALLHDRCFALCKHQLLQDQRGHWPKCQVCPNLQRQNQGQELKYLVQRHVFLAKTYPICCIASAICKRQRGSQLLEKSRVHDILCRLHSLRSPLPKDSESSCHILVRFHIGPVLLQSGLSEIHWKPYLGGQV